MKNQPWSIQQRDHAMARGAHQSATDYADFVRDEMGDLIEQGYWVALPYHQVRHLPNLRISPMGVVPQRDRRPRIIVDYTFSGVNADTVPLAPLEAMQFGKALHRLMRQLVEADPRHGPVYMCKVDIADGFYRIPLRDEDIPNLGVVLPVSPGENPLVAFPLTLPMGWLSSPPYFCTATETVADIANDNIRNRQSGSRHRLEEAASTILFPSAPVPTIPLPPPPNHHPIQQPYHHHHRRAPLRSIDVYIDDFLGLSQGCARRRDEVRRTLFNTLDTVFRPLQIHDGPHRKEPISIKKLLKGDGAWATDKVMLGWHIDSVQGTIALPPHRRERLEQILRSIHPNQHRIGLRTWQQVIGELRSMLLGIPGGQGLFCHIQHALKHSDRHRVRLSRHVHAALNDFR
ncbi:MAG: hypothetical protein ACREBR_01075 [bacterium]